MLRLLPRVRLKSARCNAVRRFGASPLDDELDPGRNPSIILPENNAPRGAHHIKRKRVPKDVPRPYYVTGGQCTRPPGQASVIPLGGEDEAGIRAACRLARDTLRFAGSLVKPGVTTESIDDQIHDFILLRKAYPSPLGYQGFPKSICTSVNNIIAHGIPDKRALQTGDIINVDITVYLNGWHGDNAATFPVGTVDTPGKHLLNVAQQCTQLGISHIAPGASFRSIGAAIDQYLNGPTRPTYGKKRKIGYSTCNALMGHGIGKDFHCPPWVLFQKNDEPGIITPGHVFTIEPVVLQGTKTGVWIWPDGWTLSTENGNRGAMFEHTCLVTEKGVDVLTA